MRTSAVVIAIVVAILALFFFVPVLRDEPWTPLRIAGVIIAVVGFALVVTARVQLGESFSVTPQAEGARHPRPVFENSQSHVCLR